MPDPRTALAALVTKLAVDGSLSSEDLARIHDAAVAQINVIVAEKQWTDKAHVHDKPHVAVVTRIETEGLRKADWPEHVDASGVTCCDCQRALVSDSGTTRVLVCPTLHGRRPMTPHTKNGAVECGLP